jgi:hypothetical protein
MNRVARSEGPRVGGREVREDKQPKKLSTIPARPMGPRIDTAVTKTE